MRMVCCCWYVFASTGIEGAENRVGIKDDTPVMYGGIRGHGLPM